ncbi:hypothetical protein GQX73_g9975 [Xylaria multiplex]|uniref:Uncharacterized protein n=1 Tax=Xylaria multiplex TaxID=323545 RepID=A0A7C8IH71_9PEZI|nr:hypothetical protein GQX73_g9975 [Xylaria multiplex]
MCQDIQKVTFHCGHQVSFWWGKSRFCLFTGEGGDRFHTTYLFFAQNENKCPRCNIKDKIKKEGKKMKSQEFNQETEKRYARTPDASQERQAKFWQSLADKASIGLAATQISELQIQIKERVVYYLERNGSMSPSAKVVLLRTLLRLPDMFNQQVLVRFFASHYFEADDSERILEVWERKKLFHMAHHAGLDRTLRAGLNMKEPIPLPVRKEKAVNASPDSPEQSSQNQAEEGLANMSLSS